MKHEIEITTPRATISIRRNHLTIKQEKGSRTWGLRHPNHLASGALMLPVQYQVWNSYVTAYTNCTALVAFAAALEGERVRSRLAGWDYEPGFRAFDLRVTDRTIEHDGCIFVLTDRQAEELAGEAVLGGKAPFNETSLLTAIGEPSDYDGSDCAPSMTVFVNYDARGNPSARRISYDEALRLWRNSPENRVQFEIH